MISQSGCPLFIFPQYTEIIKDQKGCGHMKKIRLFAVMLAAVTALTLTGCTDLPQLHLSEDAAESEQAPADTEIPNV